MKNLIANTKYNGEWQCFPSQIGNKARISVLTSLMLKGLAGKKGHEKHKIEKEGIKLFLFGKGMIVYIENPKELQNNY